MLNGRRTRCCLAGHVAAVQVTEDVTAVAREALRTVFDVVREVPYIRAPVQQLPTAKQRARYGQWMETAFTKWNALGLVDYDKVLLMDVDKLVLSRLDTLFNLPAPAGTFSSPWASPFVLKGAGLPNPYAHLHHGDRVPASAVDEGFRCAFVVIGTTVLLRPSTADLARLRQLIGAVDAALSPPAQAAAASIDRRLPPAGDLRSVLSRPAVPVKRRWGDRDGDSYLYRRERDALDRDYYRRDRDPYDRDGDDYRRDRGPYDRDRDYMYYRRDRDAYGRDRDYYLRNERDYYRDDRDRESHQRLPPRWDDHGVRPPPPPAAGPAPALQPFGSPSCHSGMDEQAICRLYQDLRVEWTFIHQRHNFIPWQPRWLVHSDGPPTVFHYFNTKPWNMSRGEWPDLEAWWLVADALVRRHPALASYFSAVDLRLDATPAPPCVWCANGGKELAALRRSAGPPEPTGEPDAASHTIFDADGRLACPVLQPAAR